MKVVFSLCLWIGLFSLISADFREDALVETNKYRAKHGADPLAQDEEANRVAQAYAEKIASEGKFVHSHNPKYGESLALMGNCYRTESQAAVQAVFMWYDEVKKYDFNNPVFSPETGHFTALVWKSTKVQGIGVAYNTALNWTMVVANYHPGALSYSAYFPVNVGPAQ